MFFHLKPLVKKSIRIAHLYTNRNSGCTPDPVSPSLRLHNGHMCSQSKCETDTSDYVGAGRDEDGLRDAKCFGHLVRIHLVYHP